MWILTNPHHFLTMYTWDVFSVNANQMQQSSNNIRRCLNHVFQLEKKKNYRVENISRANCSLVLRHEGTCSKMRWAILWTGKRERGATLHKVSNPCLDDHQFKQEEIESVGELSEVWSQIVLKCLSLDRIGWPDILWSVNKLARSVPKWTHACDRRLARLISYIHHTNEFRQYGHVGTRHSIVDWVCPRRRFCRRSWGLEINLRRCLVYFWK